MEENDIYVKESKVDLLKEYECRLQELFGVKVREYDDGNQNKDVELGRGQPPHPFPGQLRLVLETTPQASPRAMDRAKAYISSLVLDDADKCVSWERFQPGEFASVRRVAEHIESQSQAVVSVLHKERVLCIWGPQDRVARAKELMEQVLSATAPPQHHLPQSQAHTHDALGASEKDQLVIQVDGCCLSDTHSAVLKSRPNLSHTLSPSTESNHDSCYDSDSSVDSRRNSTQRLEPDWHSDVSRQASDTLASEHGDTEDGVHKRLPLRASDPLNRDMPPCTDYDAKVEFAVKLGYTEQQLQAVLHSSGSDVNQNTLLSELIKLGATEEDDQDTVGCKYSLSRRSSAGSSTGSNLRPIVIDGSNVAMSHGNKEVFSCRGIQLAVEWFYDRGHREITVFVPQWRKETPRSDSPILDQEILVELERLKFLVFTPARRVGGKRVICYDDRYILKLAVQNEGVVVSNDNYRDLMSESPEFKKVVEQRLLMYSFANDRFMPPDDPLGRWGPSLDNFLQKEPSVPDPLPPVCPYGKKCTYGNKCKYHHPERGPHHRPITEKLAEQAKKAKERKSLTKAMSIGSIERVRAAGKDSSTTGGKTSLSKTRSLVPGQKAPLSRTKSLMPMQSVPLSDSKTFAIDTGSVPIGAVGATTETKQGEEIRVSVTAVDDSQEYRSDKYNEKLSEFRKKMEEADRINEKDKLSVQSCQRLSRSQGTLEIASSSGNDVDTERMSLKLPGHWAVHDSLRPIHSDPSKFNYDRGGGHLALAKKLSDESAMQKQQELQPALSTYHVNPNETMAQTRHSLSNANISHQDSNPNLHRKLNRQLSLKGPEDHRLQSYPIGATSSMSQGSVGADTQWGGGSQQANRRQVETHDMPGGPVVHFGRPGANMPMQPMWAERPRAGSPKHVPVTRMGSAPAFQVGALSNTLRPPAPTMSRQNSTSDPQLNLVQEEVPFLAAQNQPTSKWVFSATPNEYSGAKVRVAFGSPMKPPPDLHHQALMNSAGPGPPHPLGSAMYSSSSGPVNHTAGSDSMQASPVQLDSHIYPQYVASPQQAPHTIPTFSGTHPGFSCQSQALYSGQGYTQSNTAQMSQMGGVNADTQPLQADPRHNIYYHLCALFPEDKVRTVMQQHPYETNPQILCSFILTI